MGRAGVGAEGGSIFSVRSVCQDLAQDRGVPIRGCCGVKNPNSTPRNLNGIARVTYRNMSDVELWRGAEVLGSAVDEHFLSRCMVDIESLSLAQIL